MHQTIRISHVTGELSRCSRITITILLASSSEQVSGPKTESFPRSANGLQGPWPRMAFVQTPGQARQGLVWLVDRTCTLIQTLHTRLRERLKCNFQDQSLLQLLKRLNESWFVRVLWLLERA